MRSYMLQYTDTLDVCSHPVDVNDVVLYAVEIIIYRVMLYNRVFFFLLLIYFSLARSLSFSIKLEYEYEKCNSSILTS